MGLYLALVICGKAMRMGFGKGARKKQARKSSEDAQATGYTRLEKVQAGQIWGQKSLGPTY